MLHIDVIKGLLARDLSDREKVLTCLAVEPVVPRNVKTIVDLAFNCGWRQIKRKNVSSILSRSNGLAIRSADGWELTSDGVDAVALLAGPAMGGPIPRTAFALRVHLSQISHSETRTFVGEAISCFEGRQYRAAVVLTWIGAVSVLQEHVVSNKLAEFNAEAMKRNLKWKVAKSSDDLGLMREEEFLDILQAISVIGKNVKQELKNALTLRNGCGHPNSLKVADHKVASHIEDMMLNVFAVFT
ncbi:MAG: hypothetical protein ACYDC8_07700 [Gammaproteobacteria bacterium]